MHRSVSHAHAAPALSLLAAEPIRAAIEYTRMRFARTPQPRSDDPHPVVIFPGLGTDERFVAPLIEHCRALGHATYDWGRGLNKGPSGNVDRWLEDLARDVHDATARHRQRISLVGWSLGGIYAREVAKHLRRRVRQVITIGSPFSGTPEQTNAALVYRWLNGASAPVAPALARRLRTPPPVPTTSIYSRSDGVVAWQSCLQHQETHVEHVEVEGSHLGLAWNPSVLAIVAQRLDVRSARSPSRAHLARARGSSRDN